MNEPTNGQIFTMVTFVQSYSESDEKRIILERETSDDLALIFG